VDRPLSGARIYQVQEDGSWKKVSSDYPDFYRQTFIPEMQEGLAQVSQSDLSIATKAVLSAKLTASLVRAERLLGEPEARLSEGTGLAHADSDGLKAVGFWILSEMFSETHSPFVEAELVGLSMEPGAISRRGEPCPEPPVGSV
jgi:hypothetical protein